MTTLTGLQRSLPEARRLGEGDPEIRRVSYDSRRVEPGDLFACLPGLKTDGHRFLGDALARGAAAVLLERPEASPLSVPALLVPSAREAMAWAAAALHGYPSRRLTLVGVTGTNGKTTTTYLVEALFRAAGRKTGVIGTLGARIGDRALPGDRTTPEAPDLQALFAEMGAEGVSAASMEVSSHALAQHRTLGAEFDAGIFTNLTQDHLDFHESMEAYFEAKTILFRDYPARSAKPFIAVINADDPYGRRLAAELGRVVTYGVTDPAAQVRAADVRALPAGISFTLRLGEESPIPVRLSLGGHFNVLNALAAAAAGWALGIPAGTIGAALESVLGVPGRFEAVREGQEFAVIVDYAHSPDGLENVLRAARALEPARLLLVFGCGGDRDRTKRPLMGALAAEHAAIAFVTSDNPRSEEPSAIIADILAGVRQVLGARCSVLGGEVTDPCPTGPSTEHRAPSTVVIEPDRRAAIEAALRAARAGDLVLIAGKGHENYQIFADRTIHFDDRETAREILRSLGAP
jgi:UDP-N-acetylmuramoyl-L-alanyl-D-glutamate--2,6-diaminopimelate ligase